MPDAAAGLPHRRHRSTAMWSVAYCESKQLQVVRSAAFASNSIRFFAFRIVSYRFVSNFVNFFFLEWKKCFCVLSKAPVAANRFKVQPLVDRSESATCWTGTLNRSLSRSPKRIFIVSLWTSSYQDNPQRIIRISIESISDTPLPYSTLSSDVCSPRRAKPGSPPILAGWRMSPRVIQLLVVDCQPQCPLSWWHEVYELKSLRNKPKNRYSTLFGTAYQPIINLMPNWTFRILKFFNFLIVSRQPVRSVQPVQLQISIEDN